MGFHLWQAESCRAVKEFVGDLIAIGVERYLRRRDRSLYVNFHPQVFAFFGTEEDEGSFVNCFTQGRRALSLGLAGDPALLEPFARVRNYCAGLTSAPRDPRQLELKTKLRCFGPLPGNPPAWDDPLVALCDFDMLLAYDPSVPDLWDGTVVLRRPSPEVLAMISSFVWQPAVYGKHLFLLTTLVDPRRHLELAVCAPAELLPEASPCEGVRPAA